MNKVEKSMVNELNKVFRVSKKRKKEKLKTGDIWESGGFCQCWKHTCRFDKRATCKIFNEYIQKFAVEIKPEDIKL